MRKSLQCGIVVVGFLVGSCDQASSVATEQSEITYLDCVGELEHVVVLDDVEIPKAYFSFAFDESRQIWWRWNDQEQEWIDICKNNGIDCVVEIDSSMLRLKKGWIDTETNAWISRTDGSFQWGLTRGQCRRGNKPKETKAIF